MDWNETEVRLIVEDYFDMLSSELSNTRYNKSAHREQLISKLQKINNRSLSAIEFKHRNISAALINMGLPFIDGYKPLYKYQKELIEGTIAKYIKNHNDFLQIQFQHFAFNKPEKKVFNKVDFNKVICSPPKTLELDNKEPLFRPIKTNYLKKEQDNRELGELGENLVFEFEKWFLTQNGKENLAKKVEWVSRDKGDGLGFDILSKKINGSDKYIEVKTTKLSIQTPIFLTSTEASFASKNSSNFCLYRVFDFKSNPKFFIKSGKYESFCKLIPQVFKGYF